jgi:hypothetical protein
MTMEWQSITVVKGFITWGPGVNDIKDVSTPLMVEQKISWTVWPLEALSEQFIYKVLSLPQWRTLRCLLYW